jgi:MFS family permease
MLMDKVGSWATIRASAFAQMLALIAVTLAGFGAQPLFLYLVAFFLVGFVNGTSWWSFSAFLLDLATEDRRPIYLATNGILASITVLNPVIVGALFETMRPEIVFGSAGVLALVGTVLTRTLRQAIVERKAGAGTG